MLDTARSRGSVRPAAIVAAVALVTMGSSVVLAQGGGASPSNPGSDGPVSAPPIAPGEPNPPFEDGATVAEPRPGLVGIRQQAWEHVLVAPDGRTVTVYFWSGVPECHGLDRVDVVPAEGGVDINVFTGNVPGDQVCIELAQLYKVVVVLDAPVIGGGLA